MEGRWHDTSEGHRTDLLSLLAGLHSSRFGQNLLARRECREESCPQENQSLTNRVCCGFSVLCGCPETRVRMDPALMKWDWSIGQGGEATNRRARGVPFHLSISLCPESDVHRRNYTTERFCSLPSFSVDASLRLIAFSPLSFVCNPR